MINLAVINLRDILKFLKLFLIIVVSLIILLKTLATIRIEKIGLSKIDFKAEKIINDELILASYSNEEKNYDNANVFKNILSEEFAILTEFEKELMEKENQEEVIEIVGVENVQINNEVIDKENKEVTDESILRNVSTKVLKENNKKDTFTHVYKNVKIKNESKYELTQEMLTPNYLMLNKKDLIIYHTHTCESYTPSEQNSYISSGNFRTTDLNFTVAKVGEVLSNNLKEKGINVIHNNTLHDYPAYTGSYTRSLSTINNLLSQNPSCEMIIDLHRDALGSSSSYGPCVMIGEEKVAQLMFVIGTDGGGLTHPDWLNNLKVAIAIQEKAEDLYPGLFKPMIVRNSRYNQHVSNAAFIIEVGATGNTLEECAGSMKYLANVLNEIMQ
ncbi:MAG: stage II sporulation protein P [Clostridia bacterium]|nr:stage II sporulation protein P [Clostridia bacterium]